jgi:hypothetical protein
MPRALSALPLSHASHTSQQNATCWASHHFMFHIHDIILSTACRHPTLPLRRAPQAQQQVETGGARGDTTQGSSAAPGRAR